MTSQNNQNTNFKMMMIAGVIVCGIGLAAVSVFAFPPSNKKKESA